MAVWLGAALVETDNLTGTRWFALSTNNTDPTGDQPLAEYRRDGGSQITLYYRTGITGTLEPDQADTIIIEARLADGSTLIQLHNGAPPTNGQAFTLDLTDTGAPGGSPRCGEVEFYIRAQFDGVVGDYDVDTQNSVVVGSISQWSRGLIMANMMVQSIEVSAYPAGTQFAYGTAGDEVITLTVTHTQPFIGFVASTKAVISWLLNDGSGLAYVGSHAGGGTTTVTQFTVTDQTFYSYLHTYDARFEVNNSAGVQAHTFITPDSGTEHWTQMRVDGAGLTQANTGKVARNDFFDVDPTVTMQTLTPGETVYNRGEATTTDFEIVNSRNELLTRSVNYELKDSLGAINASGSITGSAYSIAYTLTATDDAGGGASGLQWTFEVGFNDMDTVIVNNTFSASNFYMLGSVVGVNNLDVGSDYEVYNRGESPALTFYLSYARGAALASKDVDVIIRNTGGNQTEDTTTLTTAANGLVSHSYTIGATDIATSDETGQLKHLYCVGDGNSTTLSKNEWAVSDLYHVDLHQQLNGTLNKDDWPTEDATEDFDFVILGDVVYTWVHVEGVRKDNTEIQTSGSAIIITIKDPDGGIQTTYSVDTGADGWTSRINVNPTAPAGDWTHEVAVSFTGNAGSDSEPVTYVTPLTSNLVTMLAGPVLCKPGKTIRCWYQTEIDDVAADPQDVPVYRIVDVEGAVDLVAETTMLNGVDDTATINGSQYYFDLVAPTTPGRYVIWTRAQLNGNGIRRVFDFRVTGNGFDPTGLFAGPS